MPARALVLDSAFDAMSQAVVASLTSGLDDQLRRLEASVADLSVEALEWQSAPGMNAIGMLLAHLALVEVWWVAIAAPRGMVQFAEGEATFRDVVGIGGVDDGIPLAAGGAFPAALRGRTAADYIAMLRRARAHVRAALRTWRDSELDTAVEGPGGAVSRRWILYHVLEHFAGHFGQVLLIRHQLRDARLATPVD
jgi:uncharacterized damage-inducible protein DinB